MNYVGLPQESTREIPGGISGTIQGEVQKHKRILGFLKIFTVTLDANHRQALRIIIFVKNSDFTINKY